MPDSMEKPGEEIKKMLNADLPPRARLSNAYDGALRIIVPSVRTSLETGEALTLKVIILSQDPPQDAALYWRELGKGRFEAVPLEKIARGVYSVSVSGGDKDIEYYIRALAGEREAVFPVTAPALNQTVVVIPK